MTSLSVYHKGRSPKKVPSWIWFGVVFAVLFLGGNAIHMAQTAQQDKENSQAESTSSDSATAELALRRAKEKVQAVLDKQQELAEATDEDTRSRLQQELTELMKDLTSAGMREAIREDPETITLELAKMLRDGIIALEADAVFAHESGDEMQEIEHALNAQELKIALEAIRGSLDSSVHPVEALEVDHVMDEALAAAQRLENRLPSFYR